MFTVVYGKTIPDFGPDLGDLGFYLVGFREIVVGFVGPYLEDCWRDLRFIFIQFCKLLGRFFRGLLEGFVFVGFLFVGCFFVGLCQLNIVLAFLSIRS